jgi:hypothetical protein
VLLLVAALLAWLSPPAERELALSIAGLELNVPAHATTTSGVDVYLVRQPSGEVFAFLARDPHAWRCPIQVLRTPRHPEFASAILEGTCTGSLFTPDGARVWGPAPRGLDRLESRTEGDYALVDTGTVVSGACSSGVTPHRNCSTPDAPLTRRFDHWLASRF